MDTSTITKQKGPIQCQPVSRGSDPQGLTFPAHYSAIQKELTVAPPLQVFSRLLQNTTVHYSVHKSPQPKAGKTHARFPIIRTITTKISLSRYEEWSPFDPEYGGNTVLWNIWEFLPHHKESHYRRRYFLDDSNLHTVLYNIHINIVFLIAACSSSRFINPAMFSQQYKAPHYTNFSILYKHLPLSSKQSLPYIVLKYPQRNAKFQTDINPWITIRL